MCEQSCLVQNSIVFSKVITQVPLGIIGFLNWVGLGSGLGLLGLWTNWQFKPCKLSSSQDLFEGFPCREVNSFEVIKLSTMTTIDNQLWLCWWLLNPLGSSKLHTFWIRVTMSSSLSHGLELDTVKIELVPQKKGIILRHVEYSVKSDGFRSEVTRRYSDFQAAYMGPVLYWI